MDSSDDGNIENESNVCGMLEHGSPTLVGSGDQDTNVDSDETDSCRTCESLSTCENLLEQLVEARQGAETMMMRKVKKRMEKLSRSMTKLDNMLEQPKYVNDVLEDRLKDLNDHCKKLRESNELQTRALQENNQKLQDLLHLLANFFPVNTNS